MTVSWWRLGLALGGFIGVAFVAVTVLPMLTGAWRAMFFGVLVAALFAFVLIAPRPKVAPRPAGAADPWGPVVEAVHGLSTDELIATWNGAMAFEHVGTAVHLADVIMPAIAEEFDAREIPLCPCGAPQSGGIHTTSCQEIS